jgi:hypothetical protein
VQDLVGVGIADPGEEVRIGERALERVVLAFQTLGECGEIGGEDLDAARVEALER